MKKISLPIFALAILVVSFNSCSSDDEDNVVIQGEVTNQNTGNPIENATVQINTPQELSDIFGRTDELGQYSIGEIEVSEVTDLTILASATEFVEATRTLKVAPGDNITSFNFELTEEGSDDGGGDDDDEEEVGGEAGGPAQIQLVNVTSPAINVAETGGITSTTFTFEVQDSAGRSVDRNHEISFEIIRGPEGGEYITPATGLTNSSGRVTSNLVSGDSSGTVRIEAIIDRSDVGLTIRSSPVIVSISSGFPHPDNFNVAPRVYNFDAYAYLNENHTNNITVSVGDLKGNPVKEGTAVYFSASNGGLVNGSAVTNETGYATVNLAANGSTPQTHPDGVGFVDVVAQTVDKDNNYIEKTTTLLLSDPRDPVMTINPGTINVPHSGGQSFEFTIIDRNGYPMAAGSQITVSVGEGLVANGDVDFVLGDFFNPGPGSTEFGFVVDDTDDVNSDVVNTSLTVTIETPSGFIKSLTIQGTRAKTAN
ncbi:MAG: Ig-like domain-containing protein [Balneolaceae bacterium]